MKKGMILMWICMAACTGESYREYYFPLKQLKEGEVYVYESQGDLNLGQVYWYYRSFITKDGVRLTGTYYEEDPAPLQISREVMTSWGMAQESLIIYETRADDKSTMKEAEIKKSAVFSFDPVFFKKGIDHQVKWREEDGEIEVIKKRTMIGQTKFSWEGKEVDAIEIEVIQQVLHHADGTLELNSKGKEIYAKGLGLVYYEFIPEEGVSWAYGLKEKITMLDLERRLLGDKLSK